jgi:large subunit ribosomal protein L4
MPSVTVLDQTGQPRGTLALSDAVFGAPVHAMALHQAVVRELAGRRAGTHDAKGRSEVSGGGRKPWRQKGTGRARQGSIRATQWKGGGKPFGPTPRSYALALPRQMRRLALRSALTDALAGGRLLVIDELRLPEPRTRSLVATLRGLGGGEGPTLLIAANPDGALRRAGRNVPWLTVVRPGQVSVVALLRHTRVLCERDALVRLQEALSA